MGLFEKAGRRFERFKKKAEAAAEEEAEFECAACGERLFAAAEECPECGATDVVSLHDEAALETEPSSEATHGEETTDEETAADGTER